MSNTATLKNARLYSVLGGVVVMGMIYNDSKKRFEDGHLVRTSLVTKVELPLVHTLNTVYTVESWQ